MAVFGRWKPSRKYRKAADFGRFLCPESALPPEPGNPARNRPPAAYIALFTKLAMARFDALSPAMRKQLADSHVLADLRLLLKPEDIEILKNWKDHV